MAAVWISSLKSHPKRHFSSHNINCFSQASSKSNLNLNAQLKCPAHKSFMSTDMPIVLLTNKTVQKWSINSYFCYLYIWERGMFSPLAFYVQHSFT